MKQKKFDVEQYIKNGFDIKVPDCWDRIENADISNVQLVENKKSRTLPFYRVAAAVVCLAIIVTVSVFGTSYEFDGGSDQSSIVYGQDTPVRIGQLGSIKSIFENGWTFEKAYEEAELVAEIIITGWLGELDKEGYGGTTYFRAIIIEEYKNELNLQTKEIVLLQGGNSKWTYKGYPLYKNGDRLLLCLDAVDARDSVFKMDYEDCFWIAGGQLTEMQIVKKDGQKFALKKNLYQNYTDIEHLMKPDSTEIIEDALEQDEVLLQSGAVFECVYPLEDLKNYMDDLGEGDENE